MMAVLNMIQAILRDAATREQVHIIQKHLVGLGKDFNRFQGRMDALAKHIHQANPGFFAPSDSFFLLLNISSYY